MIAQLVYEKGLQYHKNRVNSLLQAIPAHSDLSGLQGIVFEQHGHAAVPNGLTVTKRKLHCPSNKRGRSGAGLDEQRRKNSTRPSSTSTSLKLQGEEEEMEVDIEMESSHHVAQQLVLEEEDNGPMILTEPSEDETLLPVQHIWDSPGLDLKTLTNFYLQPQKSNNPAWDAYSSSGDGRHYIYQYTVSKRHGIKVSPIMALLARLSEEVRPNVQLVFVVPPSEYDSFPWQPWLGQKPQALQQLPAPIKAMQQWVMKLPLHCHAEGRSASSSGVSGSGSETTEPS